MAQPSGAVWCLHVFRRLHSDRSGRMRVRYLAEGVDMTTPALRDGFQKLRVSGIDTPGRRLSLGGWKKPTGRRAECLPT